ncbi:hypothetical protein GLYMA_04G253250v4 [Glycine max]|nr:hypothetical protein GLYMA_04G253250v4 [Glycine max]KAH1113163.1 hypothetical protein GYH30_011067 [Glycine max]
MFFSPNLSLTLRVLFLSQFLANNNIWDFHWHLLGHSLRATSVCSRHQIDLFKVVSTLLVMSSLPNFNLCRFKREIIWIQQN